MVAHWPYNGSIVRHLEAISPARIQSMHRALDRYANLTMFGDGSYADGFTMLLHWLKSWTRREARLGERCAQAGKCAAPVKRIG